MSTDKYERDMAKHKKHIDLGLDNQELINIIPTLLRRRNEKGSKLINEALDEYQDGLIIDILQPLLSDWEKRKQFYSKEMFSELEAENKELREKLEKSSIPTINFLRSLQIELKNKVQDLFHWVVLIENEQLLGGKEYKAGKVVANDIIVKMLEFFPEVLKEKE